MPFVTKITDIDHKVQRLYIHWDILSCCNYKCFYCYASHYKKDRFIYKLEDIKYISNCIKQSNYPVFIGLQGGEPTLHPQYGQIISYLFKEFIESGNLKNKLYITTNLHKPLSFFRKTHTFYMDNTYMLISIHPQYFLTRPLETLDSYIAYFAEKFQKIRINVMMPDLKMFYNFYHKVFEKLISLKQQYKKQLELHPHFIYYEANKDLYAYSQQFYDEFKYLETIDPYIKIEFSDGSSIVCNDITYFKHEYNKQVEGMMCFHNNYEIVSHFNVLNICFPDISSNLLKQPDFFKYVTIRGLICPHKSCNCDGLVKILKVRRLTNDS